MLRLMQQVRYRRWIYPILSIWIALGLWIATPQGSQGFSIWDILPDAIQAIQLATLGDRQEMALGKEINQQLVTREVRLYDDEVMNDYIDRIGQRLVRESSRPPSSVFRYTFQVVDDESVNAFATLGGFVYIHTGLIAEAENEAELASVIGHEIAHISQRHAIKQMRRLAITRGLASAAGLDRNRAVQMGVEIALRLPHSREAEYEADALGLKMMTADGYAQIGMVDFMKKLVRARSVPTVLSTHPHARDRIAALEKVIDPEFAKQGRGLDATTYQDRIASIDLETERDDLPEPDEPDSWEI
ncbi:M48 family metallopeptidase [Roseofilum casamattae]